MATMSSKKQGAEELSNLEDALLENILATSGEDLRAELKEQGEDPVKVAAAVKDALKTALATAAKAQLAKAKSEVQAFRSMPRTPSSAPEFFMPETMAARKATGSEADDEVVKRAAEMLHALEQKKQD
jgi:hypothetical protein